MKLPWSFYLGVTRRPCDRRRRDYMDWDILRMSQTHACIIVGETCIQEPTNTFDEHHRMTNEWAETQIQNLFISRNMGLSSGSHSLRQRRGSPWSLNPNKLHHLQGWPVCLTERFKKYIFILIRDLDKN